MANSQSKTRDNLIAIGDSVKAIYDDKQDLKAALIAIRAYGEATRVSLSQIKYKQMTGSPEKIEYLEN